MSQVVTLIENIKQLISEGKFVEAEKKIPKMALLLVDQIKGGNLADDELGQTSDRFFTLFEIQLKKKIFSLAIEELLQRCFSLHVILPQGSRKFKAEVNSIKKLAESLDFSNPGSE